MSPRSLAVSLALVNAAIVALVALSLSASTDRRVQLVQQRSAAAVEREVTRQVPPEVEAEVTDQLAQRLPSTTASTTTTTPPATTEPPRRMTPAETTTTATLFDLTTTTIEVTLPTIPDSLPAP